MGKQIFTIERNRPRGRKAIISENSHASSKPADNSQETKNLIHNYRTIIKKIMKKEGREFDEELDRRFFIKKQTSLQILRNILSVGWFRELMKRCIENGDFTRQIFQSEGTIQSKMNSFRYFNVLMNGVTNPQSLQKWKYEGTALEYDKFPKEKTSKTDRRSTLHEYDKFPKEKPTINEQIEPEMNVDLSPLEIYPESQGVNLPLNAEINSPWNSQKLESLIQKQLEYPPQL